MKEKSQLDPSQTIENVDLETWKSRVHELDESVHELREQVEDEHHGKPHEHARKHHLPLPFKHHDTPEHPVA